MTPAEREFLIASGSPADSFDPDRIAAARESMRRRAEKTRREASPELTTLQVSQLLGSSETQVLEWGRNHDLYSIQTDHGLRFPEWQFPDGQRLVAMRLVLQELGTGMHPHSVEGLLAKVPHEELDDMTVVEWLSNGRPVDEVVTFARSASYGM